MTPLVQMARREVGRHYARHGSFSRSLDRLNRLPLLKAFTDRYPEAPCFPTRERMWDYLASKHPGAIDYLEFGVHEGHSILHWAGANTSAHSRFIGFDTFRGLPESWNFAYPKGHFDTGGLAPQTSDPRVRFVAGLFQDTLDSFLSTYAAEGRETIIHIDCDLYSSTLYCLTKLDRLMRAGTLVIFDEFGDVQNEFRALNDYLASYRRQAKLVCSHDSMFTAAIELT